MKNIATIARFELKRLFRDWRLVVMVLSQPIIIAILSGILVHHQPENIKVAVYEAEKGHYSQMLLDKLESGSELDVEVIDRYDDIDITSGRARAIIKTEFFQDASAYQGRVEAMTDPTAGVAAYIVEQKVMSAVSEVARAIAENNIRIYSAEKQQQMRERLPMASENMLTFTLNQKSYDPMQVEIKEGTQAKIKYFDYYGSSMMVLLVLLVVLNLSGISITSERASGTFERMAVTPYRKIDIIVGKASALFLIGLVVNLLGIIALKLLFGINLGNLYLLGLTSFLVVALATSLGLLVSSVTQNVVESVEMAMYAFFVSFLLSGLLVPLETAHKTFASIVSAAPFYHSVGAYRKINMLSAGWSDISFDLMLIAIYAFIFLLLAMLVLRREAK